MLPKDLLEYAEKGDRTQEHLLAKDVQVPTQTMEGMAAVVQGQMNQWGAPAYGQMVTMTPSQMYGGSMLGNMTFSNTASGRITGGL